MPSILFLNHNFRNRGTWFRNFFLARGLARRGWRATVWTVAPRRRLFPRAELDQGVNVVETPWCLAPRRFAASGFCPVDIAFRDASLADESFDVLFVSDHFPNVSLPFFHAARARRDFLAVADWADLCTMGGLHEKWNRGATRPLYEWEQWLELETKRRATLGTAISGALLDRLRGMGLPSGTTHYLPMGCDVSTPFEPRVETARKSIGLEGAQVVAGRMAGTTGISEFELRALESLAAHYRRLTGAPLTLLSVGLPMPNGAVGRLDGAGARLVETGFLEPSAAQRHLAACDFFALFEEDTAQNRSRSPTRLTSYLAAGRPVVCNDVGEHPALIRRGAAGAVVAHADEKSAALDRLLLSAAERDALGANARRLAEGELAWPRIVGEFEDFLFTHRPGLRSRG